MSRTLSVLIVAVLLAVAGSASAEQSRLDRARRYLERQAYVKARNAFQHALRDGGLDPAGTREVYRGLAETNAALRNPEEARDAYVRLLLIQPEHYVASDASPLFREPFVQAQNLLREHGEPSLDWTPPERISPDEPYDIDFELPVEVAPALADRVEVTVRTEPGGRVETIELVEGHGTIAPDLLEGAESVHLVFEVFDEHGNHVATVGAEDEPIEVGVVEPSPAEEPTAPQPERRRWYQQWWFWTIVGAVVVGAAVGIPVGLTAGQGGDPCEESLGGPCDLRVRF